MIKRILVPIPGASLGASAVDQIVWLATAHRARVTALVAVDETLKDRTPALVAVTDMVSRGIRLCGFQDQAKRAVAELTEACQTRDISIEVDQRDAELVDAACAAWRYHDLLVFPRHGAFHADVCPDPEAALVRMIVGRIGPIVSTAATPRPVRRVIVAYSGSHASAKSMKRFVQMNLCPGASVRIVTVGEDGFDGQRLLDDAADYCRAWGVDADTVLLDGPPATALLQHAREFDLIVVGDSARSLLTRKVFGDVMLQVLRQPDQAVFFAH